MGNFDLSQAPADFELVLAYACLAYCPVSEQAAYFPKLPVGMVEQVTEQADLLADRFKRGWADASEVADFFAWVEDLKMTAAQAAEWEA